jgi:hypothetical protein
MMSHAQSLTIIFQAKIFQDPTLIAAAIQQISVKSVFAALLYILVEQQLMNVPTLSIISCFKVMVTIFHAYPLTLLIKD